jgi:hypothetical protein
MISTAQAAAQAELRAAADYWQAGHQQQHGPHHRARLHMAASLDELMAGGGACGLSAQASWVASQLFPHAQPSSNASLPLAREPSAGSIANHKAVTVTHAGLVPAAGAPPLPLVSPHHQVPGDLPLTTSVRSILHVNTGPTRLPHVVLTQEAYTGVAPALRPPDQPSPSPRPLTASSSSTSADLGTADPLVASTHTWMTVEALPEALHPLSQPEPSAEVSESETPAVAPDTPGRGAPADSGPTTCKNSQRHSQREAPAPVPGVLQGGGKIWVPHLGTHAATSGGGGAAAALSSVTLLMGAHGVPRHHLPAALSALLQGTALPAASAVALAAATSQGLKASQADEEEPVLEVGS